MLRATLALAAVHWATASPLPFLLPGAHALRKSEQRGRFDRSETTHITLFRMFLMGPRTLKRHFMLSSGDGLGVLVGNSAAQAK